MCRIIRLIITWELPAVCLEMRKRRRNILNSRHRDLRNRKRRFTITLAVIYPGLANEELGRSGAAKKAYHQLTIFGEKHLFDEVSYDFFAVSLPEIEVYQDDITLRNIQYCNYLRALGAIGLGEKEKAIELLEEILKKQADHQGALSHREMTR